MRDNVEFVVLLMLLALGAMVIGFLIEAVSK